MTENRVDLDAENAYSVLGVPHDAHDTEIAAAYRSLARVYHPDLAGDSGTARMSRINAAFDRLRDERRRTAYDREIGVVSVRRPPRDRDQARSARPGQATARPARHGDPPRASSSRHRQRDGTGGAGPPPGRPSGSVLEFGRHVGWSVGEIARVDPGYLEWLEGRREGAPFLDEIDETLVRVGFRSDRRRPPPRQPSRRRPHRS
jgi:curved DNA-binding protein CbpA